MMVIPRQYAQELRKARSQEFNEKNSLRSRSTRSPSNSTRSKSPLTLNLFPTRDTLPTAKNEIRSQSLRVKSSKRVVETIPQRPSPTPLVVEPTKKKESAKDVLSSTAIPIRRKPRGRPSQRLPQVDHVANFSTLLMDDVKPSKEAALRSLSNHQFDGLFGNMDELLEEGQMFIGSEGLDSGILTTRSISEDSMASLASPDDYAISDHHSQHSTNSQIVLDRRSRQVVASEDCTDDHPLSPPRSAETSFSGSERDASPLPTLKTLHTKQETKPRQSLKSSLTASLKALRSAAQSISHRTTVDSANARARSLFEFHPGLTDDRRPPRSFEDPTADLRRYLSPPPLDAAAQLHGWQDHRHSTPESRSPKETRKRNKGRKSPLLKPEPGTNPFVRDLPSVVQLADCLPGPIKTEHASSPPIWLGPDGTPINKSNFPLLFDPNANEGKGEPVLFRHREPRENPDFLRVFVCEMQMRRAGKLSEDMGSGRARLWLPPVTAQNSGTLLRKDGDVIVVPADGRVTKKRSATERMSCLTMEDV